MKKYAYYILVLCFAGCKKAEDIQVFAAKPEKELVGYAGSVSSNRLPIVHLYKDTVYTLSQSFVREAGEQLIIDEGTLIKVAANGQPTGITIKPGGSLIANGTSEDPIVFTSGALTTTQNRNWAGIIMQGKSVNNGSNPTGDLTDFSGSLNYVRIEFAGLILNSVGDRTIIENVQVSYSSPQSSFEINGGRVNARNVISYACGGPADFYITNGYSGKMQNVLAYRHPFFGSTGSNPVNALAGLFIENNPFNPVAARPYTFPKISNMTVLGPNAQNGSVPLYSDSTSTRAAALVTTNSTGFLIRNSLFAGFPVNSWYLDDSLTAYGIRYNYSALTHSILQCNTTDRTFFLLPGKYPPFEWPAFKNFLLQTRFENRVFTTVNEFMFTDPFNYDDPILLPNESSPVLTGANFDGSEFSDPFFKKVTYLGALGNIDWLKGWTNFKPLNTNYNFPR